VKSAEAGFTLVEMLVSLALLALLSVFMVTGLRFSSQVKSAEARVEVLSQTDGARRHLRQTLAGAQNFTTAFSEQSETLSFIGTASDLTLTAPLDDRVAVGGLYRLTYEMDQQNLVLRYHLFRFGEASPPESSIIILENISALALRYLSNGTWRDSWNDPARAPQAVEINVIFTESERRKWSPLVVNLPLSGEL
jgi:general secretion pathway protein J